MVSVMAMAMAKGFLKNTVVVIVVIMAVVIVKIMVSAKS